MTSVSVRPEREAGPSSARQLRELTEPTSDTTGTAGLQPVWIEPPSSDDEILLSQLLATILRRWKVAALVPLVFGTVALAVALFLPARYTATVTFVPESGAAARMGNLGGGIAGLASQFGLPAGLLGGGAASPDYYAAVLHSRELLSQTLTQPVATNPGDSLAGKRLLDLLPVEGRTEAQRINRGVRWLEKRIATDVSNRTGMVQLSVQLASPELAAEVANRMVELLNRFNLERRQSQSGQQRRFTEQRRSAVEAELRTAERALLQFLQANRQYRGSPLLEYEASRLERQVQQKQQVYLALSQAHEEARIAEVQDTPVLTVIDPAVSPEDPSAPHPPMIVAAAASVGLLLGLVAAFLLGRRRETTGTARRNEGVGLGEAWSQARGEMLALVPWRRRSPARAR